MNCELFNLAVSSQIIVAEISTLRSSGTLSLNHIAPEIAISCPSSLSSIIPQISLSVCLFYLCWWTKNRPSKCDESKSCLVSDWFFLSIKKVVGILKFQELSDDQGNKVFFSSQLFLLLGVFEHRSNQSCLTTVYINMSWATPWRLCPLFILFFLILAGLVSC